MSKQNEFLSLFNNLSEESQSLLKSISKVKYFRKNEYMSKAGQSAEFIFIIEEGITRNYISRSGKEYTTHLNFKYDICFPLNSYFPDSSSDEYIQALTDAKVMEISMNEFNRIKATNIEMISFENHLNECFVYRTTNRLRDFQTFDAKDRYLRLLEKKPNILQEISLTHIASYLGITLGSLSRIRSII